MKKRFMLFLLLFTLSLIVGCGKSSKKEARENELSPTIRLTAIAKRQNSAVANFNTNAIVNTNKAIKGVLEAENLRSGETIVLNWRGEVDEENFKVISHSTFALRSDMYKLSMTIEYDNYKYVGNINSAYVEEGQINNLVFNLIPVIGDDTFTVATENMPMLRYKFKTDELASITNPIIKVTVDNGAQSDALVINKDTGIVPSYFNYDEGEHTVDIEFYDGDLLIGRTQELSRKINIVGGQDVEVNIVPIYGDAIITTLPETGTKRFVFHIPSVIIEEVGGNTANLKTVFKIAAGQFNQGVEREIEFVEMPGLPYYAAEIEVTDLRADQNEYMYSLEFYDRADDYLLGSATSVGTIDTREVHHNMQIKLKRRAFIVGNLLNVIGINVYDESDRPVTGAPVFLNGEFVGITGTIAETTAGYFKLYVGKGDHVIKAQNYPLNREGEVAVTANVLEVYNEEVVTNDQLKTVFAPFDLRAELLWGDVPEDLDLHLIKEGVNGDKVEVYYGNRRIENATLAQDDTNGNGPEIITVRMINGEKYSFFVRRFRGNARIESSDAKLNIYSGQGVDPVFTVNIPSDTATGDFWAVGTLTADQGGIDQQDFEEINQIVPRKPFQ